MKKKWIKLIILATIVVIVILVSKRFFVQTKPTNSVPEQIAQKEPVEWHGNYIWDGTTENNQWMCFRKKVDLTRRRNPKSRRTNCRGFQKLGIHQWRNGHS